MINFSYYMLYTERPNDGLHTHMYIHIIWICPLKVLWAFWYKYLIHAWTVPFHQRISRVFLWNRIPLKTVPRQHSAEFVIILTFEGLWENWHKIISLAKYVIFIECTLWCNGLKFLKKICMSHFYSKEALAKRWD